MHITEAHNYEMIRNCLVMAKTIYVAPNLTRFRDIITSTWCDIFSKLHVLMLNFNLSSSASSSTSFYFYFFEIFFYITAILSSQKIVVQSLLYFLELSGSFSLIFLELSNSHSVKVALGYD